MVIIMRNEKKHRKEKGLPNTESIRTLGEKETYKYLELLEADTIKQAMIKEKTKKSILDERENFSKQSCAAGVSLNG